MSVHAYLILAHKNWDQLRMLVELLDDKRNDLFIHIDKKSRFKGENRQELIDAVCYSKIVFVERIPIFWGDYSIVEAELKLLKAAVKGSYKYYHLISGMDLPIKTQDEIHAFFSQYEGLEFIHFSDDTWTMKTKSRVKYYWLLQENYSRYRGNSFQFKLLRILVKMQKLLGINRCRNYSPRTGSQWFSITRALAEKLCDNEDIIKERFSKTFCPDEWMIQTMAAELGFEQRCYCPQPAGSQEANVRLVDWKRGDPYTFLLSDYDELLESECRFARKFDETVDAEIIKKLYNNLIT